jgi:hypothetical protein
MLALHFSHSKLSFNVPFRTYGIGIYLLVSVDCFSCLQCALQVLLSSLPDNDNGFVMPPMVVTLTRG